MNLTGFTRQITQQYSFSLHRTGCKDIKRRETLVWDAVEVMRGDYETTTEALNDLIDDELTEMGFTHDDVQVFPCAKG